MDIKVNGEHLSLSDSQAGLVDVLAHIGILPEKTGIAVAVNMELVPRSEWIDFQVNAGDEVEVITARQGG